MISVLTWEEFLVRSGRVKRSVLMVALIVRKFVAVLEQQVASTIELETHVRLCCTRETPITIPLPFPSAVAKSSNQSSFRIPCKQEYNIHEVFLAHPATRILDNHVLSHLSK